MLFRKPAYYDKFRCTADKCSDNCCIGWEIDIDDDTNAYYSSVKGDFGKRLNDNICNGSFILADNERCPFLNSNNLCDIFTTLGEEHLCQICTDHPRFFEWFGSVKEGGIGLCCEAAARLILSEDFALSETEINEMPDDDYELYPFLFSARKLIIDTLQNTPIDSAITKMLCFGNKLQYILYSEDFELPSIEAAISPVQPDKSEIMRIFAELEPIDENWKPYVESCINAPDVPLAFILQNQEYLRRIAVYYIYRFFLKGIFDGDILSKVKLSAVCTWFIAKLWFCESLKQELSFEDMVKTAKNFSKEVEYSVDNLDALADAFCFDESFSIEKISGLFN